MEKNNSTFIWEGRGGSDETKNSLGQALRRSWCGKEWVGLCPCGELLGGLGLCTFTPTCVRGGRSLVSPLPHHISFTLERSG